MTATLDPVISLGLGYAALLAASARGLPAQASIAIMMLVYAVLAASPGQIVAAAAGLAEWPDLRVFVYIALSLAVAGLMRELGLLDRLVSGLSRMGCGFSAAAVPAAVGLLPMPGGALVSAMAVSRVYREAGLRPHWMVYINYWFRHIWVPVWPLFQSVLITAAVLDVDPMTVVASTWPAGVAAAAAGVAVSARTLAGMRCGRRGSLRDLAAAWPLLLIAVAGLATPLGLLGGLALALGSMLAVYRPRATQLRRAAAFALSPRIHVVLLEALLFKELLLATGAPEGLTRLASGLPAELVVYVVPFILGLGAGGENFFAATAMPLLTPYLVEGDGSLNGALLLVAYAGGYLGVMASPVHLCFALTVDYFRSDAARPMALTLASIGVTTLLVYLTYYAVAAP